MRGKRELPRKRPPILLFVLILAAGFLAGTLFGISALLVRPFRQGERSLCRRALRERTSPQSRRSPRPRRRMENLRPNRRPLSFPFWGTAP